MPDREFFQLLSKCKSVVRKIMLESESEGKNSEGCNAFDDVLTHKARRTYIDDAVDEESLGGEGEENLL